MHWVFQGLLRCQLANLSQAVPQSTAFGTLMTGQFDSIGVGP
jgi:hypothetical protein